jgi:hypothetical protein
MPTPDPSSAPSVDAPTAIPTWAFSDALSYFDEYTLEFSSIHHSVEYSEVVSASFDFSFAEYSIVLFPTPTLVPTAVPTVSLAIIPTASPSTAADEWPGPEEVSVRDTVDYFGDNLSGLSYYKEGGSADTDILWAIKNYPPTIYKLKFNGSVWLSEAVGGWESGKRIMYVDGTGEPDAEDLTYVDKSQSLYVCSEQNGHSASRLSVLLYSATDPSTTLAATMEWNLTKDFPGVWANTGFEAIAYIPDDILVSNGFFDERLGQRYDPSEYASHGEGLLLLGLEQTGTIYAYALNHDNGEYWRIASFDSGSKAIMGMSFDASTEYLWNQCDDTCHGRHNVHKINQTSGRFELIGTYFRPSGLGDLNTEGFAVVPDSKCNLEGFKAVFWADDDESNGHALREGSIPCGAFIDSSSDRNSGNSHNDDGNVSWLWVIVVVCSAVVVSGVVCVAAYWKWYRPARTDKALPPPVSNTSPVISPWWSTQRETSKDAAEANQWL